MKTEILVCCFIAVAFASNLDVGSEEWVQFKLKHGKSYAHPVEEIKRLKIYSQNKKLIEEHNAHYEKGEVSYALKMNQFGDMHPHEVTAQMNGLKMNNGKKNVLYTYKPTGKSVPDSFDWRTSGAVTDVKNQGTCGSCWAFSTTGSVEAALFFKTGKLVSLSEQNLVDCSKTQGNEGCNGGYMDYAFQYIIDNKGIASEESYPYEGVQKRKCGYDVANKAGTISGYVDVKEGDEQALKEAVATIGPISVGIDASSISFQFYSHGVFDPWFCSTKSLDHGVLVVGYGKEKSWFKTKDYWLIKNSWGTGWGESGYFKLRRNHSNKCGVATMASYPVV